MSYASVSFTERPPRSHGGAASCGTLGPYLGIGETYSGSASTTEADLIVTLAKDVESGKLTNDKIKEYAVEAGGAAAAGGCVASGAAAAAPLCKYVGGKIVGAVAGIFSKDDKEPLPDLQARLRASVLPLCEGDGECVTALTYYANVLGRCLYSPWEALYIVPGYYGTGDVALPELWKKIDWASESKSPQGTINAMTRWIAWINNTVQPWFKRAVAIEVAKAKLRRERLFLQGVFDYRAQLLKKYLGGCPAGQPSCQTEIYGIISQWAMATKAANEKGIQLYQGRASYTDDAFKAEVEGKIASAWAAQKALVQQQAQATVTTGRVVKQEGAIATTASNTRRLAIAGLLVGAGALGILVYKKRR